MGLLIFKWAVNYLNFFLVLAYNIVDIYRYNPHKQKLFRGSLQFYEFVGILTLKSWELWIYSNVV